MSFREFLWATKQDFLDQKLSKFEFSDEVHHASLLALRDYYVGGMSEAFKIFSETQSLVSIRDIKRVNFVFLRLTSWILDS